MKSKDDVIDKLVCNKRESDGSLVTLKSETGKYKDEAKRLLKEINSCIGQLKKTETEVTGKVMYFAALFDFIPPILFTNVILFTLNVMVIT